MVQNKHKYLGLMLILGLFLSLAFSGVTSASEVKNTIHVITKESVVQNNSITVKNYTSKTLTKAKSTNLPT